MSGVCASGDREAGDPGLRSGVGKTPAQGEWGDGPWEHLGDAERDVRVLLAELARVQREAAELRDALRECPCNCQWIAGQQTYHCRRCAALARGGQTDE